MIPVEASKEWAQVRFGVWPEDLDSDGALRETENALAHVVNSWIEIRMTYRRVMLDLTRTPFGRVKEMAKLMQSRVEGVLSRLDKARASVNRELSDLTKKQTPKLGTASETFMEGEVRAYLRSLPPHEQMGKLREAALVGDLVTLRAALLSPPVLFAIPPEVQEDVQEGYARALDPEGVERRALLDKALALIERAGRNFMADTTRLLPPYLVKADSNNEAAAKRAERLAAAEKQVAQLEGELEDSAPAAIPPLSARLAELQAEMGVSA